MLCKECGMPMVHHRLYGYQCRNPEHKRGGYLPALKPPMPYGSEDWIKREPVPYEDKIFHEPPFPDLSVFDDDAKLSDAANQFGDFLPFDDMDTD